MKLKITPDTMSKYLIAQLQYVKQPWVKGEGKGISENMLHDDIKICVDLKTPSWIGEIRREFRLVMSVGQRKNSESP